MIFILSWLLTSLVPTPVTLVSPDNPNLQYMGRWEFTDPLAPWCAWLGASITLHFDGTAVSATLDAGSQTEYFRIVIDGDVKQTRKFAVTPGKATYPLVEALPAGSHKIELIKETYAGTPSTFYGFEVAGSISQPPTELSARKLLFYGDSNLAGYSLESELNEGDWSLRGSHFTYAGITARMFDAQYHNISVSGERLTSMPAKFDKSHWRGDSIVDWDHQRFVPDAVILNLGANDVGKPVAEIKAAYHTMLDLLREAHSEAHIVIFNAWGWDYHEPANYTSEVAAERNDPNLSVAHFPWIFEKWHGCEYDHAGMATVLATHLTGQLGWEAAAPDVMNGYAQDGQVANGSFEETAPFGGYGWRYRAETGVSRIEQATEAREGSFFVQLSEKARIHQPLPARTGNSFSVTLWLRSHQKDSKAQVTIDFRDQKMWTDPLTVAEELFTLTPEWQSFTLTATRPASTSRPIFHARITIAAEAGIIEVDHITSSVR